MVDSDGTETAKGIRNRTRLNWESQRPGTRNRKSVMKIARIAWHIARPPIFSIGGTIGGLSILNEGRRVMLGWPTTAPIWLI
jgi:hypothetical protein